jgi:hypothetical protein
MLLSIFPDSRSVLLHRPEVPAGGRDHQPTFVIPSTEMLRESGIEIPDGLWGFAERDEEVVSGLFIEGSHLEHLLAISGARPRRVQNSRSSADVRLPT